MSIPEHKSNVVRPSKVEVSYMNLNGETEKLTAEGLLSACLQHEIDHLNGILYIDRLVSKDEFYKIQFDDEGNAEYVQINKDSELS